MNTENITINKLTEISPDIMSSPCFEKKWLLKKYEELEKLILLKPKTKRQKNLKFANDS